MTYQENLRINQEVLLHYSIHVRSFNLNLYAKKVGINLSWEHIIEKFSCFQGC